MEIEQDNVERGVFNSTKLVLFDVGGVLFRFMGGLESLSQITNIPFDDCKRIWSELDDSICRGKVDPQELWNRIKQFSSYSGDDIDFIPFWIKHFQPNRQVHELVRNLSKNYSVGLVTNIYPGVYEKAIESKAIPKLPYAFVIQSCETGFIKPEKQIYELAQHCSGQKPEDILFIDDNTKYISPAQDIGWKTFTFKADNPDSSVSLLRNGFAI